MSLSAAPAAAEACSHPTRRGSTRVELADIFREYGESYQRGHSLHPLDARVMDAIVSCRTANLGGHREHCPRCGFERYLYNPCGNRHCPKCQVITKLQWLEQRQAELLDVPYFHTVFTLPHELNPVVLGNKHTMLSLLMEAAAQTLLAFGRNNLGGQLGFTMLLHTWDQTLGAHFHVHCLIAGGALDSKGNRWIPTEPKFVFSVVALSKVFRGKFMDALRKAYAKHRLTFAGELAHLSCPQKFRQWLKTLWSKDWVVYAKPPFSNPEDVLDYLGRYTHRTAISNDRILSADHGKVRFLYRDRSDSTKRKVMTLDAHEFIRRFLLHVLPPHFVRIRHYGFLSNRVKQTRLSQCRQLLGKDGAYRKPPVKSVAEWFQLLTGIDLAACPRCGHAPLSQAEVPALRCPKVGDARAPALLDSS